jgi:Ser/Thr protein kinase RdoA (MazF antagonist)
VNPLNEAMDVIAAAPPSLDEATVLRTLEDAYGLSGSLRALISERDQNFRLEGPSGERYVVKIANECEPAEITDFQIQVLRHLETSGCPVPVPHVMQTGHGKLIAEIEGHDCSLRVVSYLPGKPAEDIRVQPALGYELGRSLALLDTSLKGFSHPGQSQVLMWDMQRAADLRDILGFVADDELRGGLIECIDQFQESVLPEFSSLRRQVIHNDLNPGNVLVDNDDPGVVSGIIDFGDMLHAPLVVDAAIAASYLRDSDFAVMGEFFRGYQSVIEFEPAERRILFDLVRTRLATTLAIFHWRASARSPDDPYLDKMFSEQSAERFFYEMTALGADGFEQQLLSK